jgi:hypothetical protein
MKLLVIDDSTGSPTHQYRLLNTDEEALQAMLEIGKATAKEREEKELLEVLEALDLDDEEFEFDLQNELETIEVYFWIRDIEVGGEVVAL